MKVREFKSTEDFIEYLMSLEGEKLTPYFFRMEKPTRFYFRLSPNSSMNFKVLPPSPIVEDSFGVKTLCLEDLFKTPFRPTEEEIELAKMMFPEWSGILQEVYCEDVQK